MYLNITSDFLAINAQKVKALIYTLYAISKYYESTNISATSHHFSDYWI